MDDELLTIAPLFLDNDGWTTSMTEGSDGVTSSSMIESSGGLGGHCSGTSLALLDEGLKLFTGLEVVMSESRVTVPESSSGCCPELFRDEILSTWDFVLKWRGNSADLELVLHGTQRYFILGQFE